MKKDNVYIEINSLSQYLDAITKNNLVNSISRGENKEFDCITSSAFRYEDPINFREMVEEFHSVIGNNLTSMQNDNFVAFSQHHGIPTNLVDFSTSPLVSLFFSCYNNDEDSGYVHFINKDRLINVNEMMSYADYNYNIFYRLLQFESNIQPLVVKLYEYVHTHNDEINQIILDWSNKLKQNSILKEKYKNFFTEIDNFIKEKDKNPNYALRDYSEKILQALIESNHNDDGTTTDFILWDEYIDDFHKLVSSEDRIQYIYFEYIELVLILLRTVFGELYNGHLCKEEIKNFNLPFYLVYSPPNILSRVANQSSLFIYQLYYDDDLVDPYIDRIKYRVVQNIVPDITIKVNNKKRILKELDALDINLKFIYNDYDSIANYIKSKKENLF